MRPPDGSRLDSRLNSSRGGFALTPLLVVSILTCACGGEASAPAAPPQTAATPATNAPLVIFLGDSLTAGLGLARDDAFPAQLAARLARRGRPIRVVNAGVSGDTTAGGLRRLDWLLRQNPDLLVVGLGANDGLRGLPTSDTEANLLEIIRRARAADVRVLLLGMRLPPSYGPDYTESFAAVYSRVAAATGAGLVPFLLEGVGGVSELNLPDGIHPNAAGHDRIAALVEPHLLDAVHASTGSSP